MLVRPRQLHFCLKTWACKFYFLKKHGSLGVPSWLSGLRIWHCQCCGSGYSCDIGLITGPGTYTCQGTAKTNKHGSPTLNFFFNLFQVSYRRENRLRKDDIKSLRKSLAKLRIRIQVFDFLVQILSDTKSSTESTHSIIFKNSQKFYPPVQYASNGQLQIQVLKLHLTTCLFLVVMKSCHQSPCRHHGKPKHGLNHNQMKTMQWLLGHPQLLNSLTVQLTVASATDPAVQSVLL